MGSSPKANFSSGGKGLPMRGPEPRGGPVKILPHLSLLEYLGNRPASPVLRCVEGCLSQSPPGPRPTSHSRPGPTGKITLE